MLKNHHDPLEPRGEAISKSFAETEPMNAPAQPAPGPRPGRLGTSSWRLIARSISADASDYRQASAAVSLRVLKVTRMDSGTPAPPREQWSCRPCRPPAEQTSERPGLRIGDRASDLGLHVGVAGFEPTASCTQSTRASQAAPHPGLRPHAQRRRQPQPVKV